MSIVKAIYDWQVAAGNTQNPYNDFLEASFQVEEALEGFNLQSLVDTYNLGVNCNAKEISRAIVTNCVTAIPDVDRLDKACDAIVFAIGSMAKLGLTAEQIESALARVNEANQAKLGMLRDSEGKLLKPADFIGPEVYLQQILDQRKV